LAAANVTVPDGANYDSHAVFLQDFWVISNDWDLTAGIRYTHVSWDFEAARSRYLAAPAGADFTTYERHEGSTGASTGEVRLGWHPLPRVTVYGGVSQGFRAPNLTNLAGLTSRASSTAPFPIPNADLKAERSLTYEIGSKWAEGRDQASIALFVTNIRDLIQTTYSDTNNDGTINQNDLTTTDNTDQARLAGVEIGHDVGLPVGLPTGQRLALIQSASAVTGEYDQPVLENGRTVTKSYHLSRANRVWGIAGVRYEPTPAWYTLVQARWSAAYDEVNPGDATDVRHTTFAAKDGDAGAMPGYAVLDLKAGWKSAGGGIRVDAAIENLGDVSYREPGSGIDGTGLNAVLATTLRY
jgi:hemoglobin/transferrin/lactoferrin receptor protein